MLHFSPWNINSKNKSNFKDVQLQERQKFKLKVNVKKLEHSVVAIQFKCQFFIMGEGTDIMTCWVVKSALIIHLILSIIHSVSFGVYPMSNESSTIWIIQDFFFQVFSQFSHVLWQAIC